MQQVAVEPGEGATVATRPSSLRVVAVASGKGGVGKTNVSANLAIAFGRQGKRVWLLDADLGLANVDVLFGLSPRLSLFDVLRADHSLADVMLEGPAGVRIIPAASGVEELTALGAGDRLRLLGMMETLEPQPDVLLVDTAAGISPNVLFFAAAAADVLIVVTPEPTALTDAYALMKVLAARHRRQEFLVVVNMAAGSADAHSAFVRLARVAERFLHVRVEYQGWIPYDDAVASAVRAQLPVVLASPHAAASVAFAQLAQRLGGRPPAAPTGGVQFFFQQLIGEARS